MKREEYIQRLKAVYDKYYCNGGKCKYYAECQCSTEEKFSCDKANVGLEYGELSPRIVVVGLEGLGKSGLVKDIEAPSETKYNAHYKGVRYVLAYILAKLKNEGVPHNTLKSELSYFSDKTIRKYSLLNCYKCAFANKSQGLPHTEAMKQHCQEILLDEIRALDPDFLVIQIVGNRPKDFVKNVESIYNTDCRPIAGDIYTGAFKVDRPGNTPLILIWTYHGSGSPGKARSWTNDNCNGCGYAKHVLNPVLDKAIDEYKSDHAM